MLRIIRKSTSRPSFMYDMNFSLIYSISCRQRPPYVLSFKVKRQSLNSRGNRPLIPHRKNFSLANSCSSLKPPLINFRVFLFFSNIFFFKMTHTHFRVHLRIFFVKKLCTILKDLFFASLSSLSASQKQWYQKAKRGRQKMKKFVGGRWDFDTKSCFFCEYIAKNV